MKFVLNLRIISRLYGFIILITGLTMIPAVITAFCYGETQIGRSFLSVGIAIIIGGALIIVFSNPESRHFKTRDAFFTVGFGWLLVILLGALPYLMSGYTDSFCAAFFESAAGFTTTGATVFNVDNAPRAFIMWKAVSHWVGGLAVLVMPVSLMPALGLGSQKMFRPEIPSTGVDRLFSKFSTYPKILLSLYVGLTLLAFLLLLPSGLGLFDDIVCTLGCVSTAGLTPHTMGISFYHSTYVESVLIIFSLLSALNFSLYVFALRGHFRRFIHNTEVRVFLINTMICTVVVSVVLYLSGTFDSVLQALRHATFQVVSFASTTGYTLSDYSDWPALCLAIFAILMLVGGCSSSTCGSMKMIRIVVMFKLALRAIYLRIHPRAVVSIKVNETPVSPEIVSQITSFLAAFLMIMLGGSMILSLQGLDFITCLSSSLAMLSNTGIGFGTVGVSGNFAFFAAPLQLVLAFLMIIGRLEIFTFLVLLTPSFWNPNKAVD